MQKTYLPAGVCEKYTGVRRGVLSRVLPRASLRLLALSLACAMLLAPRAAAAQEAATLLAQAGGREIARADWVAHLPVALGALLIVVIVDAFVIIKFIRGRRGPE